MWFAQLDRFGYTLTVIEKTRQKAIDALMTEYEKAFININGFNPKDETNDRGYTELSYYDEARSDIEIMKLISGKVEWF